MINSIKEDVEACVRRGFMGRGFVKYFKVEESEEGGKGGMNWYLLVV